jgi:hypothetical protein
LFELMEDNGYEPRDDHHDREVLQKHCRMHSSVGPALNAGTVFCEAGAEQVRG